jgi:hypothetical protein
VALVLLGLLHVNEDAQDREADARREDDGLAI